MRVQNYDIFFIHKNKNWSNNRTNKSNYDQLKVWTIIFINLTAHHEKSAFPD